MLDSDDEHDQSVVRDLVQDSIVPDAGTPDVIGATKLDGIGTGIPCQPVDAPGDPHLDATLELRERLCGRGQEFDGVHGECGSR